MPSVVFFGCLLFVRVFVSAVFPHRLFSLWLLLGAFPRCFRCVLSPIDTPVTHTHCLPVFPPHCITHSFGKQRSSHRPAHLDPRDCLARCRFTMPGTRTPSTTSCTRTHALLPSLPRPSPYIPSNLRVLSVLCDSAPARYTSRTGSCQLLTLSASAGV